jgi:hypothetical protein
MEEHEYKIELYTPAKHLKHASPDSLQSLILPSLLLTWCGRPNWDANWDANPEETNHNFDKACASCTGIWTVRWYRVRHASSPSEFIGFTFDVATLLGTQDPPLAQARTLAVLKASM